MNTTKIAALYGTYLHLHLLLPTDQLHQQVAELLVAKAQRAATGQPERFRCHVHVKDMGIKHRPASVGKAEPTEIETYCSPRVHAWALAQQPATDRHRGLPEAEVWSAMIATFPGEGEGEFSLRFGAKADFAVLLRGVQAYERKRHKRYLKLLAQLRTFHQQQLLTVGAARQALTAAPRLVAEPTGGLLPRFYHHLRRGLASKVHQVAVAAEAVLAGGRIAA